MPATATATGAAASGEQAPPAAKPAGLPPTAFLRSVAGAYKQSLCLYTATSLGVSDALAGGPLPAAELAAAVGADADRLRRVMRLLVIEGVYAEPTPGKSVTAVRGRLPWLGLRFNLHGRHTLHKPRRPPPPPCRGPNHGSIPCTRALAHPTLPSHSPSPQVRLPSHPRRVRQHEGIGPAVPGGGRRRQRARHHPAHRRREPGRLAEGGRQCCASLRIAGAENGQGCGQRAVPSTHAGPAGTLCSEARRAPHAPPNPLPPRARHHFGSCPARCWPPTPRASPGTTTAPARETTGSGAWMVAGSGERAGRLAAGSGERGAGPGRAAPPGAHPGRPLARCASRSPGWSAAPTCAASWRPGRLLTPSRPPSPLQAVPPRKRRGAGAL